MATPYPTGPRSTPTCPNGHENPEGPQFCGECGTPIVTGPPICPNGHENAPGRRFCGECGTAILSTPPPVHGTLTPPLAEGTSTQPPVATKDRSAQRAFGFVVAGLAVLVLAAGVALLLISEKSDVIVGLIALLVLVVALMITVIARQSRNRTSMLAIATVLLVLAAVTSIYEFTQSYWFAYHFGERPSSHGETPLDASDRQSRSYQQGFKDASGDAIRLQVASGLSVLDACDDRMGTYRVSDPELMDYLYLRGCQDGFKANPVK